MYIVPVCVHTYVLVCVHVYELYLYVYVLTGMYIILVYTCVCMCVCVHVCIYTSIHMNVEARGLQQSSLETSITSFETGSLFDLELTYYARLAGQ